MFEFIKMPEEFFLPFLTNIGLLALLAIAVSTTSAKIYGQKRQQTLGISIIYGLSFGVAAAILIHVPIELQEGIHGDGRGAVILLAGAIAGPISAAIASAIAAATRYELGGAGMPSGVLYIMIFGISGVLWRRLCSRLDVDMLSNRSLLAAPIIVTALSSIVLFSFQDPQLRLIILGTVWPFILASNVIGTIILGYLIRRERERFKAQQLAVEQRDRAEKATAAKNEFLSTMSHEIRTPLNGVLGILQLLKHETLPPSVTQKLKLARDSGFHLLTHVNQLLDIERIEAGALTSNSNWTLGWPVLNFPQPSGPEGTLFQSSPDHHRWYGPDCRLHANPADTHQPRRQRHHVHRARRSLGKRSARIHPQRSNPSTKTVPC